MMALLQRVRSARVEVQGECIGAIDHGLLLFVCAQPQDAPEVAERLATKVLKLRIFADEAGKMNRSVQDVGGGVLVVSQFTLAADTSGGNRPSFTQAAPPEQGRAMYEQVLAALRERHAPVACGEFGADMQVHLVNDGPVTIPMHMG